MENPRVDPVSGNNVPPGAHPEEVRDDVPIMASENEYIIPANVVRYIGVEKLDALVQKAKEALGDDSETGGEDDPDELPFDINDLQFEEDEEVPHMAEGGVVPANPFSGFGGGSDNYTGVKEFKDKDGNSMFIPYYNGSPLYDIPSGYSETNDQSISDTDKEEIDPKEGGSKSGSMDSDSSETKKFIDDNRSPLAGDPSDWSVDDFINYGEGKKNSANKAISGIISMIPGGKLALTARSKYLNHAASEQLDNMIDNGVDGMGNAITPEQMDKLKNVRTDLIGQMSDTTGLNLNPVQRLSEAFNQFTNFSSPGLTSNAGDPRSALGPNWSGQISQPGASYDREGKPYSPGSDSKENAEHTGGSYGMGSDIGRDPSKGPSEGSMASGGLYNKGGLITRRKHAN